MRDTINNGHHDAHHAVAVGLWIVAGLMAVLVFGDVLVLLALALALVFTASWVYRAVERRVERYEAEMAPAPVAHLRPAWTGHRDLRSTPANVSWRGPSAA
jgi:hypothetical protein